MIARLLRLERDAWRSLVIGHAVEAPVVLGVGVLALGLLLSGLMMWFPQSFPRVLMQLAFLVHDGTFILFMVAIVFHIYLGTSAEPGTFRSMTRGTVTRKWARLHHPGWYRQVTGEDPRRP